jgi:hypothetical protein
VLVDGARLPPDFGRRVELGEVARAREAYLALAMRG